ncbi:MAG: MFS transporter [Pseudomonadota bacterium]
MTDESIITETTEVRVSATPIALSGIIISMMMMAVASGLGFAYIPIRLDNLGFEPWVASAMFPALSLGGLFGCLVTGWMLRLSGHARVFMTVYAIIIVSFLAVALTDSPYAWLISRALYGFGINGAFIIAQSWLHDACDDHNRGKVITIFYVSYVLALGLGSFMIGYVDVDTSIPMILAVAFIAIAILPVGLTRLRQPDAPDGVNIQIRKLWNVSPVGLMGMLCVGGLTMTLQGFAPIYTKSLGYEAKDIGLMMLMMQMGLLVVQLPMGTLSDHIDRRYVLLIVATMSCTLGIIAILTESNLSFIWLILIFALWSGSIETFYSVSSALANDRADPKDYVFLSSTQMVMWSFGGFFIPLISTGLLWVFPVTLFMWLLLFLSAFFALFVVVRIFARQAVPVDEMESFQYSTAQVVNPGEYYNPEAIADASAGATEGLVS